LLLLYSFLNDLICWENIFTTFLLIFKKTEQIIINDENKRINIMLIISMIISIILSPVNYYIEIYFREKRKYNYD